MDEKTRQEIEAIVDDRLRMIFKAFAHFNPYPVMLTRRDLNPVEEEKYARLTLNLGDEQPPEEKQKHDTEVLERIIRERGPMDPPEWMTKSYASQFITKDQAPE